jgi:hypothetical protein
MSGIIGSYHNIRGSGVVNKLGTDGQVFTSTGVGGAAGFEDAAGGGKVLQLLFVSTTTQVNVATTTHTDIGLSLAITPAATSSKIYALWKISANQDSGPRGYGSQILRDTTSVFASKSLVDVLSQTNSFRLHGVFMYLDSPSSTSEITYKVQCRTHASGQVEFQEAGSSDLMLIEVGA